MPSKGTFIKVAIVLLVLGFIKSSAPDVWAKIPGLNKF